MPLLQPPLRTLRLAALSVVPFIGLASVASAAPLDPGSHGTTPSTASGSFNAASARVASPTADDQRLTPDSAIRGSGYARPFRSTSWWNTPLGRAPRDSHSRDYIRDSQNRAHTQNYLKLVLGDWGLPTYRADKSDPRYRINPGNGPTVTVHIPVHARQMPTSDGELRVVDPSTNQAVGLSGAHYGSSTHNWTASGLSRYYLNSNGIEESFKGGKRGTRDTVASRLPCRA